MTKNELPWRHREGRSKYRGIALIVAAGALTLLAALGFTF